VINSGLVARVESSGSLRLLMRSPIRVPVSPLHPPRCLQQSSVEISGQGELFPRVGFIVTNLALPSRAVVRFYNQRGTAEQWIKEGKQATHWTRL